MVTTYAATRVVPQVPGTTGRISSVVGRNVSALRAGPSYWLVLFSGFFEPVLYLFSIGVGVGALIGDIDTADGRMSYAAFVAPAMLAVSAMSGALAETTFNFYYKFKFVKIYDAIIATPVRPLDIAMGELTWAMMRSSLYTACFLTVMILMDLTTIGWALAVFPATMLVSLAFGAVGMAISTMIRGWQDFDLVFTAQFAMFLLSGTFSPVKDYPLGVEILIGITPLYHAVELVRGLATGHPSWSLLGNVAYLAVMAAVGLYLTGRRMAKALLS